MTQEVRGAFLEVVETRETVTHYSACNSKRVWPVATESQKKNAAKDSIVELFLANSPPQTIPAKKGRQLRTPECHTPSIPENVCVETFVMKRMSLLLSESSVGDYPSVLMSRAELVSKRGDHKSEKLWTGEDSGREQSPMTGSTEQP